MSRGGRSAEPRARLVEAQEAEESRLIVDDDEPAMGLAAVPAKATDADSFGPIVSGAGSRGEVAYEDALPQHICSISW